MKRQLSDSQYQKMSNLIKKLESENKSLKNEKEQSFKLVAIGEKMSQMNHNLREPLSVIFGNAHLINMQSESVNDEKSMTRSKNIMAASTIMLNQINDLTNFIKGNTLKLEYKSLNQIINNAIDLIKKPKTISIQLPKKDIMCICDPGKLQVVFMNLFTNAIEAIENEGKIDIRTRKIGNKIIIQVKDSGSGIPHDVLPKIFDILFTTKRNGTGLGLPYCKNVIEQHGGTIHVSTNPTVFTLILPKQNIEKTPNLKSKKTILQVERR